MPRLDNSTDGVSFTAAGLTGRGKKEDNEAREMEKKFRFLV